MRMKRLTAPSYWKIEKKKSKWTVPPRPGPHRRDESIPLQIALRDVLKMVETGEEAKTVIKRGDILIDGIPKKDHAFPVGLMDVLSIPKVKKFYRAVPVASGMELMEISEGEAALKLCRINGKSIVRKGKMQLNLHDGRNILVPKDEYKTGDSVLIKVPSQEIQKHLRMEKGYLGLITRGRNSGKIATLKEIITTRSREPNKVLCKLDDKEMELRKDDIFVVGKEEPEIKIGV
jgi:small subunit ribosomal protein S4e